MSKFKSLTLFALVAALLSGVLAGCMGGDDMTPVKEDPTLKDQPQRPGEGIGSEIGKKGG